MALTMIRLAKDGEVPVGIVNNAYCSPIRGDGIQAGPWPVYGYGNGKGRGSPGKGDGDGRGIPYSSDFSHSTSGA